MTTSKLKGLSKVVKQVLIEEPATRGSDSFLYLRVLHKLLGQVPDINIEAFLSLMEYFNYPPFESVRRSRQKIQAKHPELKPDEETIKARQAQQSEYYEFAKDGENDD